jgi:hypothetical protein
LRQKGGRYQPPSKYLPSVNNHGPTF